MDFFVAGSDVAADEFFAVRHGLGSGQMLPAVRAEVIAAEGDVAVGRQHGAGLRDVFGGGEAGVAAELVHLVGGGFEQKRRAVFAREFGGGADDGGVRTANGDDAAVSAVFVGGDDFAGFVIFCLGHCRLLR